MFGVPLKRPFFCWETGRTPYTQSATHPRKMDLWLITHENDQWTCFACPIPFGFPPRCDRYWILPSEHFEGFSKPCDFPRHNSGLMRFFLNIQRVLDGATCPGQEFIRGVRGKMNDFRLDWVNQAFGILVSRSIEQGSSAVAEAMGSLFLT